MIITNNKPTSSADDLLVNLASNPDLSGFFDMVRDDDIMDSALEFWLEGISLGQQIPVILAILALSDKYRQEGAFSTARRWAEAGIRVAQSLPSWYGPSQNQLGLGRDRFVGDCLYFRAKIEQDQGESTRGHNSLLEAQRHYDAEEEWRQREGITEQPADERILGLPSVRGSFYRTLSESAFRIGNLEEARRYHELWIEHQNDVPVAAQEINMLILKSQFHFEKGRPEEALAHLQQAVDIADRDRSEHAVAMQASYAYRSMAKAYGSLGVPRTALALLNKARLLARDSDGHTPIGRSQVAAVEVTAAGIVRHRPDLGDAVQHLLTALEYDSTPADQRGRDTWLTSDGRLMRIVGLGNAWPVLLQTAEILEERQCFADAIVYLHLATGIAERVRSGALDESSRIAIQDQRSEAYLRLARIQLKIAQERLDHDAAPADEAWLTLEALRARTFLDAVGDHELHPPSEVPAHLTTNEEELLNRRRKLGQRPTRDAAFWAEHQAVNQDLASVWEAMTRVSSAAADYVAIRTARPATHAEVAELLAKPTDAPASPAVVVNMLFLDDEHLVMMAVASDDSHVRVISSPVDFRGLTKFVGTHFGAAAKVRYLATDLEEEFHRKLSGVTGPLTDLCEPGQTLVICPVTPLHHVPLGAARVGTGVLLERNPIVMTPSASLLRSHRLAKKGETGLNYAVFGDPQGNLPEARQEARRLAERWGIVPCIGGRATGDKFLGALTSNHLVHVAAHARFDSAQPLESGIRMADRTVSAGEILRAAASELDLVTMSACETGLYHAGQSEDPVGLIRALLFAGANSVVSSLWRVPDLAAHRIMTEFYDNLRQGQSKADALRHAALAVRDADGDPRFHRWAAFILTGAWE